MLFPKSGTGVSRRRLGLQLFAWGILSLSLLSTSNIYAQTQSNLVDFNNSNGAYPYAGLLADANGNLFGTTSAGGAGYGTVFEVALTPTGYAATPTTLISFNYINGASPLASLIADASGNLFGTTYGGGAFGAGTIFEVANTATGYATTPTTLVNFNGSNGATPYAGLVADSSGNLLGTTHLGGAFNAGTVFELVKTGTSYAPALTTLVSFDGSNGAYPYAGLITDASGNLFGTTSSSFSGYGTVFELAKTTTGYAAAPTTLINFNYVNGATPYAGLLADGNGNLFGTTYGGGAFGAGTVFEVAHSTTGYAAAPITLVSFNRTDGSTPYAGLIADANGSLFGTTLLGGAFGAGTAFKITNTATGFASTPTTLVNFNNNTGGYPVAGLIADGTGHLFGTAYAGGTFGSGTVYEITRSGFVRFAGVSGSPNCHGVTISALATEYGGIANAASLLGYGSVKNLQSAVTAYCGQ